MGSTAGSPRRRTGTVTINGLATEAVLDQRLVDDVLLPVLRAAAQRAGEERVFAFLVGPPGVGKSTLAALLADRARRVDPPLDLDAVGIDGFHLPHAELVRRGLDEVKGAPETFDVAALTRALERSRRGSATWPGYDRVAHDVVPDAHELRAPIVLLEGTWLLLDQQGWRDLAERSSLTVFIEAHERQLRHRLTARKVAGGMSPADAELFYERSDRRNVERVLRHSDRSAVDLVLHLNDDDTLTEGEAQ